MIPPVGKSGPLTMLRSSSTSQSGWSMTWWIASTISRRLWGGTFVAMPTAIPAEPFTRRFGTAAGSTTGSSRDSS